jgi:ABC-type transport system involved in cytochrome c biogenesis permease component
MTFLPIVERELRVAARRRGTYRLRLLVALLAIIVGVFAYLANFLGPPSRLAHSIFTGLAGVAFVYCLAAGRICTADSLSEEKREGTLGLLFLTNLRGYDVVLGKLAATSLHGFYGLVAILPILAVPLLMGGITNGEFWRVVLVLLNTFLFSLAVGMLASTLSSRGRGPMALNFALLLLLIGVFPAIAGALAFSKPSSRVAYWLLVPSPAYAGFLSFDRFYIGAADRFWWSIAITHGMAWVLVLLASLLVPYSWQDSFSKSGKRTWDERWERWSYGRGEKRRKLRGHLLAINPFLWLASRARHKRTGAWAALVGVVVWWLYCWARLDFKWSEEALIVTTGVLVNVLFKTWFGIEASQRLAENQRLGALELLLSTPLSGGSILRGQLLALRRIFLGPLLVALLFEFVLVQIAGTVAPQLRERLHAFAVANALMFPVDLLALFWVGVWAGLTARTPNHAAFTTIVRVLLLPGVVFGAIAIVAGSRGPGPGWQFYLYLWFWVGVVADLVFGFKAWSRIRTDFRELALKHSVAKVN